MSNKSSIHFLAVVDICVVAGAAFELPFTFFSPKINFNLLLFNRTNFAFANYFLTLILTTNEAQKSLKSSTGTH